MGILDPAFLVSRINTIALILGAIILVIFSDFMNRYVVFPVADLVRARTHRKMVKMNKGYPSVAKYLSEGLATAIFVLYCYLGSSVLAEYVFAPILSRMRSFLLIVVIILFLVVSYVINTKTIRNQFMKTQLHRTQVTLVLSFSSHICS